MPACEVATLREAASASERAARRRAIRLSRSTCTAEAPRGAGRGGGLPETGVAALPETMRFRAG
jgi:hypothetical protein